MIGVHHGHRSVSHTVLAPGRITLPITTSRVGRTSRSADAPRLSTSPTFSPARDSAGSNPRGHLMILYRTAPATLIYCTPSDFPAAHVLGYSLFTTRGGRCESHSISHHAVVVARRALSTKQWCRRRRDAPDSIHSAAVVPGPLQTPDGCGVEGLMFDARLG